MTGPGSNTPVSARVWAILFLATTEAFGADAVPLGAGPSLNCSSFWLSSLSILIIIAGFAVWRLRERHYRQREMLLELAVTERTRALDCERLLERERNQILEMLVSNEPMGSVLDAVVRLIVGQCGCAFCAIVIKRGDGCEIAAAPDFPDKWARALRGSHSLPADIWRKPVQVQHPAGDPAWSLLAASGDCMAAAIHSWPIDANGQRPAALLLFYAQESAHGDAEGHAAELGCRMARLALEHCRLYDNLQFQAEHDPQTGLANRTLYDKRLDASLREAEARKQNLALLFVDLDRFKHINDTFTHRVGDLVLAEVGKRMAAIVRPCDIVARIGGDEFAVVVNDVEGAAEALDIANRLLESVRTPIVLEGHQVETNASAGVALYPDDGRNAEQLERAADAAMYHAKDLGRNRVQAFATRNETLDRARMEEELRTGLSNGYFVVHYQPKVRADRKIVGFEALIRMNHPTLGLIPPAEFIPIAEANGMIVPLGFWVLEEVCRQVAAWESLSLGPVPVAVNVSPVQICRPDFAKAVGDCLARYGIKPENIELELTEGMLISAAGVAQEQLRALRDLGVHLSIDDFGTGYASLSYLHRLQFDSIKLDRSFVQSIDTDDLARRLVEAMIGVAQGLGLSVVAEGVETEGQRAALLSAGCPLMQGFLFARPKPPAELEEMLRFPARVAASSIPDAIATNCAEFPSPHQTANTPMAHPAPA